MGYFSIPMAKMVGQDGKVICVDIQKKMLDVLENRARKAGVSDRIELLLVHKQTSCFDNLSGKIDFALAFAVVHEVADPCSFFKELSAAVKQSGRILVAEPKKRVSADDFAKTIDAAQNSGLTVIASPHIMKCHAVLLGKMA